MKGPLIVGGPLHGQRHNLENASARRLSVPVPSPDGFGQFDYTRRRTTRLGTAGVEFWAPADMSDVAAEALYFATTEGEPE